MTSVNKVAVVTGAGRGIGAAICAALAQEGMDVVLAARTVSELERQSAELKRQHPDRSFPVFAVDVARASQCQDLLDFAAEKLGGVDVLVNNAGAMGGMGALEKVSVVDWRKAVEVNLFGTMHCTRAAIPHMRKRGGGHIINLAGGGVGGSGVAPFVSAYATSKAAVVQFTECLAKELSADNIFINAISPGAVVTRMTEDVVKAGPDVVGRVLHERTVQQRQSGGESPEIAARMVCWLASGRSGTLTGRMLSAKWDKVDGMDVAAVNRSSMFTLRRVDGTMFAEVTKS